LPSLSAFLPAPVSVAVFPTAGDRGERTYERSSGGHGGGGGGGRGNGKDKDELWKDLAKESTPEAQLVVDIFTFTITRDAELSPEGAAFLKGEAAKWWHYNQLKRPREEDACLPGAHVLSSFVTGWLNSALRDDSGPLSASASRKDRKDRGLSKSISPVNPLLRLPEIINWLTMVQKSVAGLLPMRYLSLPLVPSRPPDFSLQANRLTGIDGMFFLLRQLRLLQRALSEIKLFQLEHTGSAKVQQHSHMLSRAHKMASTSLQHLLSSYIYLRRGRCLILQDF
jgi:hypothetical protein